MQAAVGDNASGGAEEQRGMSPVPLARRTVSNVGAVMTLAVLGKGLNLATLAIVARLLLPSDFGIIALAILFIGLLSLANDMGLAAALIRASGEWESAANAVFWATILIRAGLCAVGFAVAPLIAALFGRPELVLLLRVMTLGFLIESFGSVHAALLTRELQFGRLALVEGLGAILSSILTVGLAFIGFSYWSLVLGSLWVEPVVVAMLWALHPWRPSRAVNWKSLGKLWNFGGHITLLNTMGYFVTNLDGYAIGGLLGPARLGNYTIANRIALFGSANIAAVVNRVLFPTYAKIQGEVTRLRRGFMRTSFLVASLAIPVSVLLFILAGPIVGFILGPGWEESVAPLRILALNGLVIGLVTPAGNVVLALGKVRYASRATAIQLAFIAGAIYPAIILGGITGAAVVVLVGVTLGGLSLLTSALQSLGVGKVEFASNLGPILLGSGVTAGLAILGLPFTNSFWGFALVTGTGGLAYTVVTQLASRGRLSSEARSMIGSLIGKAERH